jgi:hypothetical protein
MLYWWFQTCGFKHVILPNLTFIFVKMVFKPPTSCNIKYPLAIHFVVGSLFSATASLDRDTCRKRFQDSVLPLFPCILFERIHLKNTKCGLKPV